MNQPTPTISIPLKTYLELNWRHKEFSVMSPTDITLIRGCPMYAIYCTIVGVPDNEALFQVWRVEAYKASYAAIIAKRRESSIHRKTHLALQSRALAIGKAMEKALGYKDDNIVLALANQSDVSINGFLTSIKCDLSTLEPLLSIDDATLEVDKEIAAEFTSMQAKDISNSINTTMVLESLQKQFKEVE